MPTTSSFGDLEVNLWISFHSPLLFFVIYICYIRLGFSLNMLALLFDAILLIILVLRPPILPAYLLFEPFDFCFFRSRVLLKHLSPSRKQLTRSIGIVSLNVLARYRSTMIPFSSIRNSLGNIVADLSPFTTAVLIIGTTCLKGNASLIHPNKFRRPTRKIDDTAPSGSARAWNGY